MTIAFHFFGGLSGADGGGGGSVALEVGVAVEAVAVIVEELAALVERDAAGLDRLGDPRLEGAHHLLGIVFHPAEHVLHGLAVDGLVDLVAVLAHGDVYGVGVAEEVVEVAEYLLVGTDEEDAEVVLLVLAERVDGHGVDDLVLGDVALHLAVRVAGHVLEGCLAVGALVEALQGHDGEDLVDAPHVGQRLEEREVAVVLVGKELGHVVQLLGHALHA